MYSDAHNHACNYITVDYQRIVFGNIANQIHGFTIDYGKSILIVIIKNWIIGSLDNWQIFDVLVAVLVVVA